MNFKPVEVPDYDTLKKYFAQHPYNLSVYSPASIIAWSNGIYQAKYTFLDGICFIVNDAEENPADRHLILPVSGQRYCSPSELNCFAREFGYERYWYVPEDYLEMLDRSEIDRYFDVQEQKGFDDYVYLTEDLIRLRGNKFSKKRNLIHQFTRDYLLHGRVKIASIEPEDIEDCLQFLEIWCEQHTCDADQETSLACEKKAVITTLNHLDFLEARGILIRIDGVVSAFGIGTRLNATTAALNFEKAFSGIKGLYQFLDNECAKRLFADFLYINKECDMNLPNLAESKQSYNPIRRIKSFLLALR